MAERKQSAGARPIWSGSVTFGLVTFPVQLFTAVREKTLSFRSLHDQDHQPLKQKMVSSADGKEVHREHIVKGFEIEKDRFVIIRQDELNAVAPKATKAIEIIDFVQLDDIDPLFFDRPYHVVPKPEGLRAYQLLRHAMERTGKVGIAKIVMHNKEYLSALRVLDDRLCLETLHFSDEIVPADAAGSFEMKRKVDERELKIAEQLIESLTVDFKPEKYKDEYREAVMQMIDKKAEGAEVSAVVDDEEPKKARSDDLIATLQASLAKTRTTPRVAARPVRRRRSA